LDSVIDFKREVYQLALSELARYLSRGIRMQQLAWGSPLEMLQSFYVGEDDEPQEPKSTDKP
jgi:putative (di)nucleoside polyphosphate hydrolase